MGMRRRPLARAAVVGGVLPRTTPARSGRRARPPRSRRRTSRSPICQSQQQYAPEPQYAPPPAAGRGPGRRAATTWSPSSTNLKKLLDEGILTQAEFDMQKQKLLAGS